MPRRDVEEIEFGDIASARDARDRYQGFIDEERDNPRSKTVAFNVAEPGGEDVAERAAVHAGDSRAGEAEKYGQAPLTDAEKDWLREKHGSFKEGGAGNYMKVRAAKAVLQGKGVNNWRDHYQPDLTVDEHRSEAEGIGGEMRGGREREDSRERDRRMREQGVGALHNQAKDALDRARDGNREAREFFLQEGKSTMLDVRPETRDTAIGSVSTVTGRDAEMLEEINEERSDKALRHDMRRSAEITRDPLKWARNPGQYDYPGVDTVQPGYIQDQRTEHAREVDRRREAPTPDDIEDWAQHPERYDVPGVDTPSTGRTGAGAAIGDAVADVFDGKERVDDDLFSL